MRLGHDDGEQQMVIRHMGCIVHTTVHLPGAGVAAGDVPVRRAAVAVEVHLQLVAGTISGQFVTMSQATGIFTS